MAKAKRVTYFKARVEDKPGALLALAKDLSSKKLGLVGLKGIGQTTQGEVIVLAKSPDKLRNAWKASGTLVEEGTAFLVTGTDKTGALVPILEKLAGVSVNVAAIEAVAVSGRVGTVLWGN